MVRFSVRFLRSVNHRFPDLFCRSLTVISPALLELGDEFRQVGAELCKVELGGLVKIHVRVGGVIGLGIG